MMPVTMRQGPIVFAHRGGGQEDLPGKWEAGCPVGFTLAGPRARVARILGRLHGHAGTHQRLRRALPVTRRTRPGRTPATTPGSARLDAPDEPATASCRDPRIVTGNALAKPHPPV